jgi:hypothetical protein
VTFDEYVLLIGPALGAGGLVVSVLRKQFAAPSLLAFFGIAAGVIAALLSFFSGFTLAWTIPSADLWVVLAAAASAFVAAGLVLGTVRLSRARQ